MDGRAAHRQPTHVKEQAREPSHRLGPAAPRLASPSAGPRWSTPAPVPSHAARSVGRWWWPILAVGGFLAVVVQVLDHDPSAPGLSYRGLLTVALAAVVVVLLTIHRRYGPRPLARAVAEYTVVALLAALLATDRRRRRPAPSRPPGQRPRPGPRPRPATTSPACSGP